VLRNGRLERGTGAAFELRTAFAGAALRDWTYRGREVRFVLARDDYFSNRGDDLPRLEADLDDGPGFVRSASTRRSRPATHRPERRSCDCAPRPPPETRARAAFAFAVRALATPTPNDTLFVAGTVP
jgi:hypothetical protein